MITVWWLPWNWSRLSKRVKRTNETDERPKREWRKTQTNLEAFGQPKTISLNAVLPYQSTPLCVTWSSRQPWQRTMDRIFHVSVFLCNSDNGNANGVLWLCAVDKLQTASFEGIKSENVSCFKQFDLNFSPRWNQRYNFHRTIVSWIIQLWFFSIRCKRLLCSFGKVQLVGSVSPSLLGFSTHFPCLALPFPTRLLFKRFSPLFFFSFFSKNCAIC